MKLTLRLRRAVFRKLTARHASIILSTICRYWRASLDRILVLVNALKAMSWRTLRRVLVRILLLILWLLPGKLKRVMAAWVARRADSYREAIATIPMLLRAPIKTTLEIIIQPAFCGHLPLLSITGFVLVLSQSLHPWLDSLSIPPGLSGELESELEALSRFVHRFSGPVIQGGAFLGTLLSFAAYTNVLQPGFGSFGRFEHIKPWAEYRKLICGLNSYFFIVASIYYFVIKVLALLGPPLRKYEIFYIFLHAGALFMFTISNVIVAGILLSRYWSVSLPAAITVNFVCAIAGNIIFLLVIFGAFLVYLFIYYI